MGKAARFACIFVPMLCTLASLIIIIVLGLAGTNNGSMKLLSDCYLFRIDARELRIPGNPQSAVEKVGENLEDAAQNAAENVGDSIAENAQNVGDRLLDAAGLDKLLKRTDQPVDVEDFYSIFLWSYCWGDVEKDDSWETKECKKPKFLSYKFDIQQIMNDHDENDKDEFQVPQELKDAQPFADAMFKAMGVCYALGALATAVTFVIGWFGLLSRWGSCVTLIFADAAFFFILAGSIMSTVISYSFDKFSDTWNEYGMKIAVGPRFVPATWVLTIFSLAAALFWLFSTCCCSGRRQKVMQSDTKKRGSLLPMQNAPYNYERVASPYQPANVPLQPYGNSGKGAALEPMRHH